MSMNGPNGCSTCQPGQEKWEVFGSMITHKTEVQYEYRTPAGELFTTVRTSLDKCRQARDLWLKAKEQRPTTQAEAVARERFAQAGGQSLQALAEDMAFLGYTQVSFEDVDYPMQEFLDRIEKGNNPAHTVWPVYFERAEQYPCPVTYIYEQQPHWANPVRVGSFGRNEQ